MQERSIKLIWGNVLVVSFFPSPILTLLLTMHVWVLKQMFVLASLAYCHQPFLAISWEIVFQINFLDDYIWLLNNIILFQFTAAGCRRTSKADLIRMDVVKKVISKCCTKGLSDTAHSGYMSHPVGQVFYYGDLSPSQQFLVSSWT